MARRVTTLILAGGESTRFRSDKAFADWNGRPFLAWVADAVRPVTDALVILTRHGGDPRAYAAIAPGATLLPDRQRGGGPVEALRGAIHLVRTPTALVAPCDAPGVSAGLARRLVAMCEELRRPVVAAPPTGPVWDLFAIPAALLKERLQSAQRLEDLTEGAEMADTEVEGLNVNEPVGPTR